MTKVGLIGLGKWGSILYKKLDSFCDVKFTCRSKDTYLDKLDSVDWVVVSTPNQTHYEIVKDCLNAGKNVFCEKPLTPTYKQSKELFDLAKKMDVRLYVDDVQNHRELDWELSNYNLVERKKKDNYNHSYYENSDLLYRLGYHDFYYLYPYVKDKSINKIQPLDVKNKVNFIVEYDDIDIEFCYDTNYEDTAVYSINGCSMAGSGDDDPLGDMLEKVINYEMVDFDYNEEISLYSNNFIDMLNKKLFKSITVVGGGIFGCTAAWMLAKEGYNVNLFEKNDDILTQASAINQYRLHKGYHYPRSKETVSSSLKGYDSFLEVYGDSVLNNDIKHFYAISSRDSLVSALEYIEFLDEMGLEYKLHDEYQLFAGTDLAVEVDEVLFDHEKLRELVWEKLKEYKVNVFLDSFIEEIEIDSNQIVVNATYSNINLLNSDKRDYQHELCEKPVLKLPDEYKNKSIVIMDGPFMCVDPLGKTGYHVMGNVVHAIHNTNIGEFPEAPKEYEELLNKGIIHNPKITNIDKFIESAKEFFEDIEKSEHIGSMFTFRTVLPNREHDDSRPTIVEQTSSLNFSLFSGKIGTCVEAAETLIERMRGALI